MKASICPLLLSSCLIFNGCHPPVSPLSQCDFLPQQKVITTYTNAKGILRQYRSSPSFYVEILECNCQVNATLTGLTAPPIPCNLPPEYQKDGLTILFSGQLRADTTLNYSVIDISGIPLELTKIQSVK